jgi:hypothetical protein
MPCQAKILTTTHHWQWNDCLALPYYNIITALIFTLVCCNDIDNDIDNCWAMAQCEEHRRCYAKLHIHATPSQLPPLQLSHTYIVSQHSTALMSSLPTHSIAAAQRQVEVTFWRCCTVQYPYSYGNVHVPVIASHSSAVLSVWLSCRAACYWLQEVVYTVALINSMNGGVVCVALHYTAWRSSFFVVVLFFVFILSANVWYGV